ncbi:hypothetical protein BC628DRAFT_1313234 [Trametes gibbosa]|nr:hypothetical protein BC628DRAFT_1313234 [Trametes gibbosa]
MTWLYTYRLCTFLLATGLGVGVAALCLQSEGSKAIVYVDSKRNINVLYAHVGAIDGVYTTVLLLIILIRDSCHRPLAIVYELVLLAVPAVAWIVVAILALVKNGENFEGSVCNDSDSIANDICRYAGPIVGLSIGVAAVLVLYLLVLSFVAWAGARRGTPIWLSPVPRSSAANTTTRLVRDLESKTMV